jgi:ABC-type nickel/cobalt efflux system permease component RcnA
MVSSSIGFVSSFLLGALHSLEPGHGKSILALNTSKSLNPYQGIWMLVSILVSHFSLVIAVALVFMFLALFAYLRVLIVSSN